MGVGRVRVPNHRALCGTEYETWCDSKVLAQVSTHCTDCVTRLMARETKSMVSHFAQQ